MTLKQYKQVRVIVALFISLIVASASVQDNYLLALAGVITGMIVLIVVRTRTRIRIDERETSIREKAALQTYTIFAPTLGLGSVLLNFFGQSQPYLFALGQVCAYLTLFLISLYALTYARLNRRYGGGGDDE